MGQIVREKMIMMGVCLILLLSCNNLVSSLADVQENSMKRRMTNESVSGGEGHVIVSTNRRGTGGGHSASASHGSSGGRGYAGGARGARGYAGGNGGGNGGNGNRPGNIGVIPIYAAGAANNNRYNQHRRSAAPSPKHNQFGFISLRTCLILAILVSFII